ncbi:hypothetical protein [Magnetospirillum fulvum]|uniref:hypothetical protein n=1 Tax=Magnetospirillum fulvum TaxID=1082 RepID=UPI0012DCA9EA|nr:hypothetical protein [Magnetospirillum fulvum]
MSVSALAATTSSTSYPIMVNGFLCYSTTDVQSARSGSKPQKSSDSVGATNTTSQTASTSATSVTAQARAATSGTQTADAVGSTAQSTNSDKTKDLTQRGAQVDLFA